MFGHGYGNNCCDIFMLLLLMSCCGDCGCKKIDCCDLLLLYTLMGCCGKKDTCCC